MLIKGNNLSVYLLVEDVTVISASSLSSLSASAHDRDGDDFGVSVINQSGFPVCLSPPLLPPARDCLYLNNKALISVSCYSAGHCISSVSLCLLPLCFVLNHTCLPTHTHPPLIHFLSSVLDLTSPCPSFSPLKVI